MEVGGYVLYNNYAWKVVVKRKKGTYQISRLGISHELWRDIEVSEGVCTVITKEVADVFIASNFNQPKGEVNE